MRRQTASTRSLAGLAQQVLELGEDLLDRVEIGAVGRQEDQLARRPLRMAARTALALVAAEIVHDHDVAGLSVGSEHLLDIGAGSSRR